MCGSFKNTWQNDLFYRQQIAYTLYIRLLLIRAIIFLKHVVDIDVLIVKILLKLVFLQVIIPKSLSKFVIQQVADLRMLFI